MFAVNVVPPQPVWLLTLVVSYIQFGLKDKLTLFWCKRCFWHRSPHSASS